MFLELDEEDIAESEELDLDVSAAGLDGQCFYSAETPQS